MAVCYETWTVNPNKPIETLDSRLWKVEGLLGKVQRTMAIVRLDDGRLLLHNAIALDEAGMAAIDAWGEVAAILIPNAFHRMDARIMAQRYPKAKVYAPAGAAKDAAKATPVHGTFADCPQDAAVRVKHLPGIGDREGLIEVEGASGLSVVMNDMLVNIEKQKAPMDWFLGPTGQVAIPRFARWLWTRDKAALKAELQRLADAGPVRLIPGHGHDLQGDVAAQLQPALDLL